MISRFQRLIALVALGSLSMGACQRPRFFRAAPSHPKVEVLHDAYHNKVVRLDGNGDGYIDEIRYFHAGVITMIEFDYDEDGTVDEVRHYDSQRVARANPARTDLNYAMKSDTRPESVRNPGSSPASPDPRSLPDSVAAKPWEAPAQPGATAPTPAASEPVAATPPAATPAVATPPVTSQPASHATPAAPVAAKPAASRLTEPEAEKLPVNLYMQMESGAPDATTDVNHFAIAAAFTKKQNFYVTGTADLRDGTALVLRCKRGDTVVFATRAEVQQGRYERYVAGWNKQLGNGGYAITVEFLKKSADNAKLYTGDTTVPETLKASTSLQLQAVTPEQLSGAVPQPPKPAVVPVPAEPAPQPQPAEQPASTSQAAPAPIAEPEVAVKTPEPVEPEPAPEPVKTPVVAETPAPEPRPMEVPEILSSAMPTPEPREMETSILGNYFIDMNLQLKYDGGQRMFHVDGKSNLPEHSAISLSLYYGANLVVQNVAMLQNGAFAWDFKLEPGTSPCYGTYAIYGEFTLEAQDEAIRKQFIVSEGQLIGENSYLYGSKRLADDQAETFRFGYKTLYRDLKSLQGKIKWEVEKQRKTFDSETWNQFRAATQEQLSKYLESLAKETQRSLMIPYPQTHANLQRALQQTQDLMLGATYSLFSKNGVATEGNPALTGVKDLHKDYDRLVNRVTSAMSVLKDDLDPERSLKK